MALAAAATAQRSGPEKNSEAIKAFELAGWAADQRVEYAEALERLRSAEKLTDRTRGPVDWARVQFAIAYILDDEGQYGDTEEILRAVLSERERVLGPEHPDTLRTRVDIANSLYRQGKYAEAEVEYRAVRMLLEKVFGREQRTTLRAGMGVANALDAQGKYAEAESEYRAVLEIQGKVLGPEHPDTLSTCFDLARCLRAEGANQEGADFARRAVNGARRALGAEHPDTRKYEQLVQDFLASPARTALPAAHFDRDESLAIDGTGQ